MNKLLKGLFLVLTAQQIVSCTSNPDVSIPASNIQANITVTRTAGSSSLTIAFSKLDTWTIYQGTSLSSIDKTTPLATTSSSEILITGLNPQQRYYFLVTNKAKEEAIVSETGLAIASQPNFRDLGGIITTDGHSVKWGLLYRSGALNKLTTADQNYMQSAGILVDIDFRNNTEKATAKDIIPASVDSVEIPILTTIPTMADALNWMATQNKVAMDTMFIPLYKVFITDFQPQWSTFFKQLETGKATVFHCSAGKDRTGVATALLLAALGVDRTTIMNNYLETNQYIVTSVNQSIAYYNSLGMNGELLRPSLMVNATFLQASFDTIDQKYGGMDNYLKSLGVDIVKLKSLYLE